MVKSRILTVEDVQVTARYIELKLKQMGFEVCGVARSGEEALRLVAQTMPDLVLMDINLQDNTDGVETAIKIKKQYNIPIVFLTAYSDNTTLERTKDAEPYGYLVKPFEERELYISIILALHKFEANEKVKSYQQQLAAILNSITDGVLVTNNNLEIEFMNPVAEQLTGFTQIEAKGQMLSSVYRPQSLRKGVGYTERDFRKEIQEANLSLHARIFKLHNTRANRYYYVDERITPLNNPQSQTNGLVVVLRDSTDKIGMEQQLYLLELAIKNTKDAIIISSVDTFYGLDNFQQSSNQQFAKVPAPPLQARISFVNEAYINLTGFLAEEVLGTPFRIVPDYLETQMINHEFYAEQLMREGKITLETSLLSKNGEEYIVDCQITIVHDEKSGAQSWVAIQRDITDKKRVQNEMARRGIEAERKMMATMLQTQERERQRFAEEVHDRLGLSLSVLKMNLTAIESLIQLQEKKENLNTLAKIKETILLTDQIANESRNISRNLMPSMINDLSLVEIIEYQCTLSAKRNNIKIFFHTQNKTITTTTNIKVNVFRLLEELFECIVPNTMDNRATVNVFFSTVENLLMLLIEVNYAKLLLGDRIQHPTSQTFNAYQDLQTRINILNGKIAIDHLNEFSNTITIEIPLI